QVVGNRLLDGLRERAGSSYTPTALSNWPLDMEGGGYVLALVQMAPADIPAFYAEVDEIMADLSANGPTADELNRVIEPMRQYIFRAQTGHTFWLNNIQGSAFDPHRVAHLPTLAGDYILTTPEEMQALAQRYLVPQDGFRVVVLPREQARP
ncbi:MAG TPA: hypothetical protein VLA45_12830, partial [Paracoccaceae bacterium]|nr:hypothetical protein [Paracoccaceae bacterium]